MLAGSPAVLSLCLWEMSAHYPVAGVPEPCWRQVQVPEALPDLPGGSPGPGQDKGTSVQLRNPEVLSETTGGAGRAGGHRLCFTQP